jgi:iron complex outermembrane receptor protein
MYGHGVTFTGNIDNAFNKTYWEMKDVGAARNGALSIKVNW